MYNDLNELLSIPSVKGEAKENAPFGIEARRALDWFLDKAKSFGLRCGELDGYYGWAEYGDPNNECIGVLGHLDVVPAGDGWEFDPYKLTIKDGYLYGRGVVDDKGPTLAALYALKNIKDAAQKLKRRIRVIVGCDEESGSACMHHYAKHGDIPVMSITPDADFPIINSEKGILRLKIAIPKDGAMLSSNIKITGGTTINVVPPLAKLTAPLSSDFAAAFLGNNKADNSVFDSSAMEEGLKKHSLAKKDFNLSSDGKILTIESYGVAGHAMAPHKADNALWKLFKLANILSLRLPSPCADAVFSHFCRHDAAEKLGVADFDEESGDLTVSMDIAEDDGKNMLLSLDIRYPRTSDAKTIEKTILSKMPKGSVITVLNGEPPLYISKDSEMVKTLLRVYHECTGLPAYTKYCGGGTYARRLPNAIAFGATFPDTQTNIHNIGECISKEQFEMLPKIYERAMIELAKL